MKPIPGKLSLTARYFLMLSEDSWIERKSRTNPSYVTGLVNNVKRALEERGEQGSFHFESSSNIGTV